MELPKCIARGSDTGVVLDALDRPASNVEGVELLRFRLNDISERQLDTLYNGCSEEFDTLALEHCVLCERFFAYSSQRLAARRIELRHFRVASCEQVGMTTLIAMTALLSSTLEVLELSSCRLARQAGIILSQSLQGCKRLRQLILADNNLRDGGLRAVVDGLKTLASARTSTVASIVGSEETPSSGLELLDISQNGISTSGFAVLANLPIVRLNATNNSIDSVSAVLGSESLAELDIRGNELSDSAVEELARLVFSDKSSITTLDLRNCHLSLSSISHLQRSLQLATTFPLRDLQIGDQANGPAVVDALIDLKQTAANLQTNLLVTVSTSVAVAPSMLSPSKSRANSPTDLSEVLSDIASATKASIRSGKRLSLATIAAAPTEGRVNDLRRPEPSTNLALTLPTGEVVAGGNTARLREADVEYIVSKTIECMNYNFEARLGQFLSRMETQQSDKNASQIQVLLAKVETCERVIPRLEARLDVLTDRVATGGAQLAKLQTELQGQLFQVRQEVQTKLLASGSPPLSLSSAGSSTAPTTPLSSRMHSQVDELVSMKIRASEQLTHGELQKMRREASTSSPQAVVDAVSLHLAQFKRELDDKQTAELRQFTETIVKDGLRVEDRMLQLESQVANLESVMQSEQQASLLALEAISEAFQNGSVGHPSVGRYTR